MVHQPPSVPQPEGPVSRTEASLDGAMESPKAETAAAYLSVPEVIQHPPNRDKGRTQSQGSSGLGWRWLLLALLSCLATSAAAVGALLWLVNLPPSTNCDDPTQITTDRAALSCAQVAADDGNLDAVLAGLKLVEAWGPNHWLSHEIDPLVEEWSAAVVAAAEQDLRQGRRDEAIALLDHIPRDSAWYGPGQELLAGWNQDWDVGSALVTKAKTAMAQQDWRTASAQVTALGELRHPYWREDQVQAISRQIQAEQQAQAQIRRAVTLASGGGTERLIEAMGLLLPLSPDLLAYKSAQTYLERWSDLLLAEGLQRWYNTDLERAMHISRAVARYPNRAQVAQDLMWLSHARQLARDSIGPWKTTPQQMAKLYRAMLLANHIPPDSPYRPQAESSVATWREHLAGMGTLQLAQIPGGIAQISTLKLAIQQAESIPPDHPQRVQAQTLIAHWQQLLERIEDAPYLTQAHRWAKANTPEGLHQAVASASRILPNRALRQDAQGWIYVWTHRLQILEDQPALDRAYALAEQGQLSQAVVEAATVQTGRALYNEAQTAIAQWRRTIAAQEQTRYSAQPRPTDAPSLEPVQIPPQPTVAPVVPTRPSNPVAPPAAAAPPPSGTAVGRASRPGVMASPRRSSSLPDRIETVPDITLPRPTATPPRPLMAPVERSAPPLSPPAIITTPPPVVPAPNSALPPESALPTPLQGPPPAPADASRQSANPLPRTSSPLALDSSTQLRPAVLTAVLYSGALYAGL